MQTKTLLGVAGAVSWLGLIVACEGEKGPPPPADQPCALGGAYLVGAPTIVDGACAAWMPTERDFFVATTSTPTELLISYAGATMRGQVDDACLARAPATGFRREGFDAQMAAVVAVDGDRLEATIDLRIELLAVGESCDVRYMLVGQRVDGPRTGNPLGGSCGTGASCVHDLCVFGEVSACALGVCAYQRDEVGAEVFCTEPCEIGSCPAPYVCEAVAPWVYRSDEVWFCVLPRAVCGDGAVIGREVCDDGNTVGGDGCSADCRSAEACGNGVVDAPAGEACDDANLVNGDGCNQFCVVEACGNGVIDAGEDCDDENVAAGDGCGPTCRFEACGNAILDPTEGCDDGNLSDSDGCDGQCRVRSNLGRSRVDAGWARALPGGGGARIVSHRAVALADRLVWVWTEGYALSGPFGETRETYISTLEAPGAVAPPRRLTALAGWELSGAARRGDELWLLVKRGGAFALTVSRDAGGSFAAPEPVSLSGLPLTTFNGAIGELAADEASLYLVVGYELVVVGANRNLFFSRSADGVSWAPAVRLSPAAGYDGFASAPILWAGGGGLLAVVWGDGAAGSGSLHAARSRDGGATWVRLNERLGAHAIGRGEWTAAALAPSPAGLLLAFAGPDGLRVLRWDGLASPWSTTVVAAANELAGALGPVALAADDAAVELAFAAGTRTLVARSTDGGASFTAPRLVGRLPAPLSVTAVGELALVVDEQLGPPVSRSLVLAWQAEVDDGAASAWTTLAARRLDDQAWSAGVLPLTGLGETATDAGHWQVARLGDREAALVDNGGALWWYAPSELTLAPPPAPPPNTPGADCPTAAVNGGWCRPSLVGGPRARRDATVVAAGSSMILFGGTDGFAPLGDGGLYDAATDTWQIFDVTGAEVGLWPRTGHSAVWTGSELLVFGGFNGLAPLGDGARFDPATGSWTRLASAGAPTARHQHVAVFVGGEMVVFGGRGRDGVLGTGARYRPLDDTWTPMAHKPEAAAARLGAVAAGSEVIVFGGVDASGAYSARGMRYDLEDDLWVPLPNSGAPAARADHHLLWTGSELLVWGGVNQAGPVAGGGRYDLAEDRWLALTDVGAPAQRRGSVAVARELFDGGTTVLADWIIWGGLPAAASARYRVGSADWQPVDGLGAPSAREGAAAVWIGHPLNRMVVFGGVSEDGELLADGGILVANGPN